VKKICYLLFIAIIQLSVSCGPPEKDDDFKVTIPPQNIWQTVYQNNIRSVPEIIFEKCYVVADYCTDYGHGTGFVIADNVVATNYHVAEWFYLTEDIASPPDTVYYQIYAKYPATTSQTDNYFLPDKYYATGVYPIIDRDLALLQIPTIGNTPVKLTPDSYTDLMINDKVLTVGYPGFSEFVGAEGKINDLYLNGTMADWILPDSKLIEFSSATNNGSSGGPVFNQWGDVIGVDFAYYVQAGQKIPVAVSIDYLKGYDFANLVFDTQ